MFVSKLSRLHVLSSSAYTGPSLIGADDSPVVCTSSAAFTIHFDRSAMLGCLPRRAYVLTHAAAAVPVARPDSSLVVFSAVAAPAPTSGPRHTGHGQARKRHLRTCDEIHARLGVTDPLVFAALAKAVTGVRNLGRS